MKIIDAGYEIMTPIDGQEVLKRIEAVARTCYKSEGNIKEGSAEKWLQHLSEVVMKQCLNTFPSQ